MVPIIQWEKGLFETEFREGDIALRDIYAPYDFTIKADINTKATDVLRKEAMDSVLPVYRFDIEAQKNVLNKVQAIIDSAISLKGMTDITEEDKKIKITEIAATNNISEALLINILELKDPKIFYEQVKVVIGEVMSRSIITTSEFLVLKDTKIERVTLVDTLKNLEIDKSLKDFFTIEDFKKNPDIFTANIKDKKERLLGTDFVASILNINVTYDRQETELRRQFALQRVEPVYNTIGVKKNETILNKGVRIGKEHIAKLKGLEQKKSPKVKIEGLFGIAILITLFMILVGLYIKFYEPDLVERNKELALLALLCVLIIFTAKVIVISPWPSNLVPVSVASMLIAILIDSRLAIIATCFLSILVGMISGSTLDIVGLSTVGGIVGIFAIRNVRRRSQVISAGLAVGFANMSYLISMGLLRTLDFNTYFTESLFGLGNGIMSAIIVTGTLPVFENLFKITTDISLLELADLNHPLLKEMVINAPGTYHHSLVVGNLAEAACETIGANSLLARVSSYFHDIGKIEKASYFSENQSSEGSAHDKLSPTMSSLIITNHVKNGVELAQKYKLNRKIIDIIKQHHGSGLVFYFFKRALEKVQVEDIGEQPFRYPGPKPQTREAACVLLADSVEAASRALDDPTPSSIKGLVRKIINNKFIDGQLDECELTLKDLEKIAEVFIHILTGIYHSRVEYPEEVERTT
jgi:putative nucleotidyltransferase with HDIG domain